MNSELFTRIIYARYGRIARSYLDELRDQEDPWRISILLLKNLSESINRPIKYPGYKIPKGLSDNKETLLPSIKEKIAGIQESSPAVLKDKLYDLFVDHNWLVKYCTSQWFVINAGFALEITTIGEELPEIVLAWLREQYDVMPGDKVLHWHVISNNERASLKEMGIDVPYDHWDKHYFIEALTLLQEIVRSNHDCKGIFVDGSWTFNPDLFKIAPDGRPYASFTFMQEDSLVGDRVFLKTALPGNDQENQYYFAIKSERRHKYIEQGLIKVDVYCIFYPRERLLREDFQFSE